MTALRLALMVSAATALLAACVYDPQHPCGPNLRLQREGVCVCMDGLVLDPKNPGTCIACPLHETPMGNACACVAGYARPTANAPCEPAGLGDVCDDARPCASPVFSVCHGAAPGYCTQGGCSAAAPCPTGWACVADTAGAYCKRPPDGQGRTCASDADCAGSEATWCESTQLKQCLVQGCSVATNDCSPGRTCCDLSKFGTNRTVCLPTTTCP